MIRRVLQPNLHRRSAAVSVRGGFLVGGFPAARGGLPAPVPGIAHNYNFSTPATDTTPLSGQCLVADTDPNRFKLNRIDADGNNTELELFNVRSGDVFHVSTAAYRVVGIPVIAEPIWTFAVIPGGTPPADGLYAVTVTRT
jgi:hypothetical protein